MKVIVTGATGFVGSALVRRLLSRGDRVVAVSRNPDKAAVVLGNDVTAVPWSPPASNAALVDEVNGADAIVNLAGEPLADKRWTRRRRIGSCAAALMPAVPFLRPCVWRLRGPAS